MEIPPLTVTNFGTTSLPRALHTEILQEPTKLLHTLILGQESAALVQFLCLVP